MWATFSVGRFLRRFGAALLLVIPAHANAKIPPPPPSPRPQTTEETKPVDTSNAPFRVKLVSNAAITRRAASTFASVAKQPTPSKLSADQRKLFADQTKWLSGSAIRLTALYTQMDGALAKGSHAPVTELAQMNMQFVTLCEAIETESHRFTDASNNNTVRARHAMAMNAIRTAH